MPYKNLDVLKFYKELPFNAYSDADEAIKNIKKINPTEIYPPLKDVIHNNEKYNFLEIGCGVGWFSNSLKFNYNKVNVVGVDFNSVAINFANEVQKKLDLDNKFVTQDLFEIDDYYNFDLIISVGVLHHTNNCLKGIEKIISLSPKYFFIGLYHKHGRKPFLDHFEKIKSDFSNMDPTNLEDKLFDEYKKLDSRKMNDVHLKSWFKDQVIHPHETQHTLEEVIDVVEPKYSVISTSLNNFKKIDNMNLILESEKLMFNYALEKIQEKKYYPGFFVFLCKKNEL